MARKLRELIVDSFAGGGGASLGIFWATGRHPDIAINHDAAAIAMHAANHPKTKHFPEDVWKVSPRAVTKGRKVGLLWASPDCKHFSRAKGSKPVSKNIRSLAWVVCKWAAEVKPRVIILENVREFADWGPLLPMLECKKCSWSGTAGQAKLSRGRHRCASCNSVCLKESDRYIPDPDRKGVTFKRWVGRLKALGYHVEWKNLDAADYGAPTHRKRLFLVARRDGAPIVWPEPTHAAPSKLNDMPLFDRPKPYRTAAECIDFTIPCPSIFDRKKPLAEKTLRRIAMGLKRYVLECASPFLVRVEHGGEHFRGQSVDSPLSTITAKNGYGIVSPTLVTTGYSERPGQAPRAPGIDKPLGTAVATNKHALVAAHLSRYFGQSVGQSPAEPAPTATSENKTSLSVAMLTKYHGQKANESRCRPLDEPANTLDTENRFGLVASSVVKFRGDSAGHPSDEPLPTITSGAGATRPAGAAHALGLQAATILKHYGGVVGHSPDRPLGTVTAVDHHSLSAAYLARFNHGSKQWSPVDEPIGTVTAQGLKFGLVYAFLVKYYGTAIGQFLDDPLDTVTGKHRFGVVTVEVQPGQFEPAIAFDGPGGPYVIADIGLRMLAPRELARAQGFPDEYVMTGSQANQVARIGNSVCPIMAKVLTESNYVNVGVLEN